jgi:hypothetical protein
MADSMAKIDEFFRDPPETLFFPARPLDSVSWNRRRGVQSKDNCILCISGRTEWSFFLFLRSGSISGIRIRVFHFRLFGGTVFSISFPITLIEGNYGPCQGLMKAEAGKYLLTAGFPPLRST